LFSGTIGQRVNLLATGVSGCANLQSAAATQGLPIDFFTRLIRQKSNFDLKGLQSGRSAKRRPICARQCTLALTVGFIRDHRVFKEAARWRKYLSYGPE
jgi:hypothetical protein